MQVVLPPSKHTQRRYNVAATSRRCSDVVTTLLWRYVFAGVHLFMPSSMLNAGRSYLVFKGIDYKMSKGTNNGSLRM